MKSFVKRVCVLLLASWAGGNLVMAQTAATATNKQVATAPRLTKRYTGKIASLDAQAKTFILQGAPADPTEVTSDTKITKDKKPATFEELAVGQMVTGAKHQDADGKWVATAVNVAVPKPPTVDPKVN
jgi:hypothetical protein